MDRYHPDISLQHTIERVVDAWFALDREQRQLSAFETDDLRPEPPSRFDGIDELLEYNMRKDGYEVRLAEHNYEVKNAQQNLRLGAKDFLTQLPEGVPLVFTYQTHGRPWGGGKKYEIVRTPEGDQPSIEVRPLEGES